MPLYASNEANTSVAHRANRIANHLSRSNAARRGRGARVLINERLRRLLTRQSFPAIN